MPTSEFRALEVRTDELEISSVNVRRNVGDITELRNSIQQQGILEPLLVREKPDGGFEVIIGSRRLTAARELGLSAVPVVVQSISDTQAIIRSLVENVQRGDLSLEDRVTAYKRLQELDPGELGSSRALARVTGVTHSKIIRDFEAFDTLEQLRPSGIEVVTRLPPSAPERQSGRAIPERHATLLQQAMSATQSSMSQEERDIQYEELARAIAPLERGRASELLNYFKMYPERPVEELQTMAFARVERQVTLPANTARRLEELASREPGRSVDDVITELVETSPDPVEDYPQYPSDFEDGDVAQISLSVDVRGTSVGGPSVRSEPYSPTALPEDPVSVQVNNRVLWNLGHWKINADFFTIGYSGRTIDEFIRILTAAGSTTLFDIRANPVSQYKPDFSKENLQAAIEGAGLAYSHRPDLGVPSEIRKAAAADGSREPIWAWYDENVLSDMGQTEFSQLIQGSSKPTFMCVETDPGACHRHRIFMALEGRNLAGYDL